MPRASVRAAAVVDVFPNMSFYSNGTSFRSSFSSPESGIWDAQFSQTHQPLTSTPKQPPRYSNQDIVGLNQKLDHMVTIMMEQKSIIERGRSIKAICTLVGCCGLVFS